MSGLSKHQARIPLPEEFRRVLDPIREKWNPERARGNPAHITILYHDEAPSLEVLEARLRAAVRDVAPFRLVVRGPERFREPARGVFLQVSDPAKAISSLRAEVLRPPFVSRERFGLHVTILHPDQGFRTEEAWDDISGLPILGPFDVSALQIVGSRNEPQLELRMTNVTRTEGGC